MLMIKIFGVVISLALLIMVLRMSRAMIKENNKAIDRLMQQVKNELKGMPTKELQNNLNKPSFKGIKKEILEEINSRN